MKQLKALKTKKQDKTRQNLQRYAHGYKVKKKACTNLLNSDYASFQFANIDSIDLLGAAHISYRTVSIVTAQTSCHVAVDESNRNQLESLTTANQ